MITCRLPRRFLAAVGDANDPRTWSGIPYHFLQAAKAAGLLDEGLPLAVDAPAWRLRRWSWNAAAVLSGDRPGGYQYSTGFLETLWAPHRPRLPGASVINCFQLYPPSVVTDASVEKWFFIDQTLRQMFDHYRQRGSVGRRIAKDAVEREREGYQAAAGVVVHSRWAARSVVEEYGIPAERVHVVVPGANVDADAYARWEQEEEDRRARPSPRAPDSRRPLRLVFVGKDWRRKGLDRLLRGLALARLEGANAALRVIGCRRESLPWGVQAVPGVEWCGFIDKRREAAHFLRMVAECDVGCLLSRAEAGGIVLREYQALGLAVLGTTVGGAPDHVCPEVAVLVDSDASDDAIARAIFGFGRERAALGLMKEEAWRRRRSFLYRATVSRILELVDCVRHSD